MAANETRTVKRVGRPKEILDPVRVNVSLESADYDKLDRYARQAEISVPAAIRAAVSALKIPPSKEAV